jgi:hypothetical protein
MTAVEWLVQQIETGKIEILYSDKIHSIRCLPEFVNQANELFEQQIKDAYVYGFKECEKIHEEVFFIQDLSDDYYLQTFKKDKL